MADRKDCGYPECGMCERPDCDMDEKDINALRKRRRWAKDPERHRKAQNEYRRRVKSNLPHCDDCDSCLRVINQKGDGFRRLCMGEVRLIEQKVSNSPQWCRKRRDKENENSY